KVYIHRSVVLFVLEPRLPRSTLFPSTTLFRSAPADRVLEERVAGEDRLTVDDERDHVVGVARRRQRLHPQAADLDAVRPWSRWQDRKSTRLNSSHVKISYAALCLKITTLKHIL